MLPDPALVTMQMLGVQLDALVVQIRTLERRLLAWHRPSQTSQRLATIPGVGFIMATTPAASISVPGLVGSGREFAVFLGLVPWQNSSVCKDRLGWIT